MTAITKMLKVPYTIAVLIFLDSIRFPLSKNQSFVQAYELQNMFRTCQAMKNVNNTVEMARGNENCTARDTKGRKHERAGYGGTDAHGIFADNIDVFCDFGHFPPDGEKGNRGIKPS